MTARQILLAQRSVTGKACAIVAYWRPDSETSGARTSRSQVPVLGGRSTRVGRKATISTKVLWDFAARGFVSVADIWGIDRRELVLLILTNRVEENTHTKI